MRKTKMVLFIFNAVISLMSIAAVLGYFYMPLFGVEAKVTFTEELVEYIQGEIQKTSNGEESAEDDETDEVEVINEILTSFKEDGVSFRLRINLYSSDFINAALTRDVQPVESMIEKVVDDALEDLSEDISKAVRSASKAIIRTEAKKQIKNTVIESMSGDGTTSEEAQRIQEVCEEILTEEFIDNTVDTLMDAIQDPEATVESVTDALVQVVDNVVDKLAEDEEFAQAVENYYTEEVKQQIRDSVEEVLSFIADEEGNIDLNDLINELIVAAINGEDVGKVFSDRMGDGTATVTSGRATAAFARTIAFASESELSDSEVLENDSSNEEKAEDAKAAIKAKIMESITDEVMQTVIAAMAGIGYLLFFTFFTWIYLIIKIVVKAAMKNPGIALKLPIWLGWLPYLFAAIPSLVIYALKRPDLISGIPDSEEMRTAVTLLNGSFDLNFTSGAVISFIIAGVLFVFSFVNWHYRRKMKKLIKQEKAERLKQKNN